MVAPAFLLWAGCCFPSFFWMFVPKNLPEGPNCFEAQPRGTRSGSGCGPEASNAYRPLANGGASVSQPNDEAGPSRAVPRGVTDRWRYHFSVCWLDGAHYPLQVPLLGVTFFSAWRRLDSLSMLHSVSSGRLASRTFAPPTEAPCMLWPMPSSCRQALRPLGARHTWPHLCACPPSYQGHVHEQEAPHTIITQPVASWVQCWFVLTPRRLSQRGADLLRSLQALEKAPRHL